MDSVLAEIEKLGCFGAKEVRKNNDKRASVHYYWRSNPKSNSKVLNATRRTDYRKVESEDLDGNIEHVSVVNLQISTVCDPEIMLNAFCQIGLPSCKLSNDRGSHTIELDKSEAIPWIVSRFNKSFRVTESKNISKEQMALIHMPGVMYCHHKPTLNMLRCLVIAQHLKKVLLAGRNQVTIVPHCCANLDELIWSFLKNGTGKRTEDIEVDTEILMSLLNSCSFVHKHDTSSWHVEFSPPRCVQGNNLTTYHLRSDSIEFKQLCCLTNQLKASNNEIKYLQVDIYHIYTSSSSYHYQVMLEVLKAILPSNDMNINHHLIEVNNVKLPDLSNDNAHVDMYVRSRRAYMQRASEEKYGSVIHDSEFWTERIDTSTLASIKFELLSRQTVQPIVLSNQADHVSDVRSACFVLYNSSRLSTLFTNYHNQVDQGLYPPMVPLEAADFSLLKTMDEWTLVFYYINTYPILKYYIICELKKKVTHISAFSQVVKFLNNLCRDLSTYYSRTHILGENKPHLIPTMMARLWLLKFIHEILRDALCLLTIVPFDSM